MSILIVLQLPMLSESGIDFSLYNHHNKQNFDQGKYNDFKMIHEMFNCCFDNTKDLNEIKNRETTETNKDNPKYFG